MSEATVSPRSIREYLGFAVLWLCGFPAMLPAVFALYATLYFAVLPLDVASGNKHTAQFQGSLSTVCTIAFVVALTVLPTIVMRRLDTWTIRMLQAREPNEDERGLVYRVETLLHAAGIEMPAVRVIDTDAINAMLLGSQRSGYTLVLTTGSRTLKLDEQEALVAIALAGARSRVPNTARLLIAATSPLGVMNRLLHTTTTWKRIGFATAGLGALSIAGGMFFDGSIADAIVFATVLVVGVAAFAIPATAVSLATLLGLQLLVRDIVIRPIREEADAFAVNITGYMAPIRRLLVRSMHLKTRPHTFPAGMSALWALPAGTEASKQRSVLHRIRRLDTRHAIEIPVLRRTA
jgi:hypothetical protein